jgi:hypothetical protein
MHLASGPSSVEMYIFDHDTERRDGCTAVSVIAWEHIPHSRINHQLNNWSLDHTINSIENGEHALFSNTF